MRPSFILAAVRAHPRRLIVAAAAVAIGLNVVAGAVLPAAQSPAGAPADLATVDAWLDGQLRDAGIPGAALVVVQDGRIVEERGFGVADASGRPVTATTPFMIGSLTKSMTALAVMQLVDAGRVDLDAPVRSYLPSFALADPGAAAQVTVRQLLTHTSGIPTAAGTAPLSAPATDLASQVAALRDVAPVAPPGTRYAYSNANYLVLGRLIEVLAGQPYGAYLAEHLFAPLGMAHAATDVAAAQAAGLGQAHRLFFGFADAHAPLFRADLVPAGFVAASADDMGRFLLAELGEPGASGARVISASALATMHTGAADTGMPGEKMAMGWAVARLGGEPILAHAGSTTDMAAVEVLVPGRRLGVAVLFDAQSVLYELLHKPDAIGLGVAALLTGRQPGGTFVLLYPTLDLVAVAVFVLLGRGLLRAVRGARLTGGGGAASDVPGAGQERPSRLRTARRRAGRAVGLAVAAYLGLVVPVAILVGGPALLGAGWPALARTDLGMVLLGVAGLRLAIASVRAGGWLMARRARRRGPNPRVPVLLAGA